ncbi:DUF4135 domain-containing protein [Enterococcus sp. AZ177]|uniref:DUF4135 domain-containing protein n=1 Tax=unclassified Enterococcus TaxID=2608891 RepID=UPI003D300B04
MKNNVYSNEEYIFNIIKKTTTIEDKINCYQNYESIDYSYLEEWKGKKSLINKKIFNYELDNLGYSLDQFSYGVSPLKKEKINSIRKQDWVNMFLEVMSNFDIKDLRLCTENKISISYAPFLQYVSKKIDSILNKFPDINIPVYERKNMVDMFNLSLLSIVGKVMIIEINNFRKKHNFKTKDSKEQLIECLNIYFESEKNFLDFYRKYAVCTKLLCMRTEYFVNNFEFMLSAIENSKNEIKKLLNIEKINIEKLNFSAGDSHEKGKSVVILTIDSKKIVFKPKNLDVCKKFENFIRWVNTDMNLLEIKFPRGVYEKEYAFQEWIEVEECNNEKEVADFYERFGYLSAISYILSGTDFHYENIIANGQFPVIVDGETFFQNPPKIKVEGGIEELVQRELMFDSVLSSALFPQYTNGVQT